MKKTIFFLFAMMSLLSRLFAQGGGFWTRVQGPSGTDTEGLMCTSDGILYQSMYRTYDFNSPIPATLYRSSDQGQHWTRLHPTLNGQFLNTYINVGKSGIFNTLVPNNGSNTPGTLYRSYDEGESWVQIAANLPYHRIFETPGGALIARAYTDKKIWRSTDGGANWTNVFEGPEVIYASDNLKILQNGILVFEPNDNLQYYSADDGQTWQTLDISTLTLFSEDLFISSSGTFFMFGGSLYRSDDAAQSWQLVQTVPGVYFSSIVELTDGSLLAASTGQKLCRSTDDGQSWQLLTSDHGITQVFPFRLSDGSVFGRLYDGLYRSADGGNSWQFATEGIDNTEVFQMAFHSEDTIFAMMFNGLQRSIDGGANWKKITDNKKFVSSDIHSFALGSNGQLLVHEDQRLYWSEDFGQTLTDITPPFPYCYEGVAISPDDSLLFANSGPNTPAEPSRIMRSSDYGQSWQVPAGGEFRFSQMEFHPSGRFYAFGQSTVSVDRFWYSDDRGLSWLPVEGLPPGVQLRHFLIDPTGIVYCSISDFGIKILRSVDNGANWVQYPNTASLYPFDILSINAAGHLFLGGYSRSLDQGVSWQELPGDGYTGDDLVNPISPAQYLYSHLYEAGFYRTTNPTTQGAYIGGNVRQDADADCSTPDAQMPLANWIVKAAGPYEYVANTDSAGHYLMFVDTGAYAVSTRVANPWWWEICEGTQMVQADSILGNSTADFSVVATSGCPLMTVDLTIPRLRRCFDNILFVNYCNQGSEPADSAWVEVILDPYVDFVSATLPAQDLGDKTYRFYVGDVAPSECGQFSIVVNVDCDSTVFGQTHCFSAHAFPDTLCTTVPVWSGATIQAKVTCQDTVIHMNLKNVGSATSQPLEFIIIVDDVVLMQGTEIYDIGEDIVFDQPADGHTWRIESEQEPGHPFATSNHIALAFAEGCGGFETLGFINQYPVDEFDPSYDRECLENTASFDPNDKQGLPLGTGNEHQIRPGQDLEYLIRFQNTGTDTAFTVMIRDTLSAWLDAATVRPGASSHPYTWNLSGQGVLQFNFNQIMLPDSNVNEAASHGFISFRVQQKPALPLGTQILNEASIYFDFNLPVVTNQTLHTIGVPVFTGTAAPYSARKESKLLVSPNPASDYVSIRPLDGVFKGEQITVTDARGTVVRQLRVNGPQCRIERKSLPQGLYFFQLAGASGQDAGSGTFLFTD